MKIQKLYKAFKKAEAEYLLLDEKLDADWLNEELHNQADKYYEKVYHPAFVALIKEVQNLTGLPKSAAVKVIESADFEEMIGLKIA